MNKLLFTLVFIILSFEITIAQESIRDRSKNLPDALFSPQLVSNWKDKIGLTPEQLKNIEDLSNQLEKETQAAGQQIKAESDALLNLLAASKVDEPSATEIISRILDLERQLRINEVLYLIRIKNILTENQQKQLSDIRSRQEARTWAQ
jgi:Spy/CpxP family protein refolding chaperone